MGSSLNLLMRGETADALALMRPHLSDPLQMLMNASNSSLAAYMTKLEPDVLVTLTPSLSGGDVNAAIQTLTVAMKAPSWTRAVMERLAVADMKGARTAIDAHFASQSSPPSPPIQKWRSLTVHHALSVSGLPGYRRDLDGGRGAHASNPRKRTTRRKHSG